MCWRFSSPTRARPLVACAASRDSWCDWCWCLDSAGRGVKGYVQCHELRGLTYIPRSVPLGGPIYRRRVRSPPSRHSYRLRTILSIVVAPTSMARFSPPLRARLPFSTYPTRYVRRAFRRLISSYPPGGPSAVRFPLDLLTGLLVSFPGAAPSSRATWLVASALPCCWSLFRPCSGSCARLGAPLSRTRLMARSAFLRFHP